MSYFHLLVLASFLLQVISLVLLPKWWKAAACPTLPLLLAIVFDISAIDNTASGNLAGVVTEIFLAPLTIGYLSIVLVLFGIAKVVQAGSQSHDSRLECQHDQDAEDASGGS